MITMLVFALALLLAALISKHAERSVLSTAVLFLVAGFIAGEGVFGFISLQSNAPIVARLAEFALFSVLFTDGMRVGIRELTSAWRLPGRALLLGMPLTLIGTALLGHFVADLSWPAAFLIGAVLSPTDPVFAAAIVGREEIPYRLRHLLNVESGLNDGLALPMVLAMLTIMGAREIGPGQLISELGLGVMLGIAVPWIAARIEQLPFFAAYGTYQPLFAVSVGLLVLSLASLTHANEFLAAFAAGVTLSSAYPDLHKEFQAFGEPVTELLKLAALLVFGALITAQYFTAIQFDGYVFAVLTLVAVRPLALGLALVGSRLGWREWLAAAWFGPKGFASVVYGLLLLGAGLPNGHHLFHLIAIVIIISIITHSSSDALIARWLQSQHSQV